MPYSIHKQAKGYAIVNRKTGKTVGHSATKANAQKSINARNASHHSKK